MVKASDTGGVKPINLQGRLSSERERLVGMSDEERAFRHKYLKAQELAADEPRVVPEMYKATFNPIRRFYRWPLDRMQRALEPMCGPDRALKIRWLTGKFGLFMAFTYATVYYFKYNGNNWTRKGGWKIIESKKAVLPGDPGYPKVTERTKGSDYADRGFKDLKLKL